MLLHGLARNQVNFFLQLCALFRRWKSQTHSVRLDLRFLECILQTTAQNEGKTDLFKKWMFLRRFYAREGCAMIVQSTPSGGLVGVIRDENSILCDIEVSPMIAWSTSRRVPLYAVFVEIFLIVSVSVRS